MLIFVIILHNILSSSHGQSVLTTSYSIKEPSYLVVAPKVIRPGEQVKISATIYRKDWPHLLIKALVYTHEQEVASETEQFINDVQNHIIMQLPQNIKKAEYFLRVEGKLETGEIKFSNTTQLIFDQKGVSVLIQLEKPDYRHETLLRFRVIPMYPDMSAYFGTMDVFIIGPAKTILKRWENIQPKAGVASLDYQINDAPPAGQWAIKAVVMGHETFKYFNVIEFYQWKFEVNVSMPHYFLTTSPGVSGVVVANYTTGRGVQGKCLVRAKVKPVDKSLEEIEDFPFIERFYEFFDGVVDFFYSMDELRSISGGASLDQQEVVVEARVEDPHFLDSQMGSFITTLLDPKINLKFLGKQPRAFKPRRPFTTHVAVSNQDGTMLVRQNAFVRLLIEMDGSSSNQTFIPLGPTSIVSYTFIPDDNVRYITITASYVENGQEMLESVKVERAIRYRSPSNSFISIQSSTPNPTVGQYMIFTVRCSRPTDFVHYHIVSSGNIIFSDLLKMNNKQKTFDVAITRQMSPSAHIIAYYIRDDGEFVVDSYNFHVDSSSVSNKVNVTINRRKDLTGDTIEVLAYASPQSMVGFAALDDSIVRLYNGGSIITDLMVYDELYSFDVHTNVSFQYTWNADLGTPAERVFFPSESYAFDAASTFAYTGLVVFTDLNIFDSLNGTTCNATLNQYPCLEGRGCFTSAQRCDKKCDCQRDCADETNCPEVIFYIKPFHERFSPKIERLYQLSWLWADYFTLPDGRVQFRVNVPKEIANYRISAFAMSRLTGFGILKMPLSYQATRQFYIKVEIPETMRLGEQVGILVDVFNFQPTRIEALIILHASEDYKFVNIEEDGMVSSFAPKLTNGQHQVLVILHAQESRRLYLPICPTRIGMIEIKIEALSGVSRDMFVGEVSVKHEGVANVYHTPYLLALVNMPRMVSEFEINANQTFLLPLQQIWSYVPGSPECEIHVTGDVAGPYFFKGFDEFFTADHMVKKSFAPVEAGIFSFGTIMYDLLYTRQGHGGRVFTLEQMRKMLNWANHEYQRILCGYNNEGAFTQYGLDNSESVWLTSWALMVLKDAVDPIYELNGLFIDPEFLNTTLIWLIGQQNPINGSFADTTAVKDRKFQSNFTLDSSGQLIQLNLSLTAQCVIALRMNSDVRGVASVLISNAINKGRLYLEQHLSKITDAFELSIVTYALHLTNSPFKDIAFQRLFSRRFKNDYGVYWSNVEIPKMTIYWPSKNPRQNWKPESNHEGLAVAATSYALLTYLARAEKQVKYEIMTWLQSQRNHFGGMVSTYDTLIAKKALVLYAITTGDAIQRYSLNINFTSSSSNDLDTNMISIDDSTILERQIYSIKNVWGNVLVDGEGTGFALLQMMVRWNVEYDFQIRKAPYEAFNISMRTRMYGRNISNIDYHVCLNWIPENSNRLNSNRSGHAQFQIEIPTGYRCEERYLKSLIGVVRNLGDGENQMSENSPRLDFIFEYLDTEPVCFNFTIYRYIPVANISRYYFMHAFEYHEPGNANRSMYHLRDVFGLDICEVCGSYQCPYCPHYAHAHTSVYFNVFLINLCLFMSLKKY